MQPPSPGKGVSHADQVNREDIFYHTTKMRVPLFEVDLGQAVYHGNYFHLFESARDDFLRTIGFPYCEFMKRELHLSVVESTCIYRRPLHYDDQIEIRTGVDWSRTRRLAVSQWIFRVEEDGSRTLCTQVILNMVCVRFSGKPTVLPEDFRQILNQLTAKDDLRE